MEDNSCTTFSCYAESASGVGYKKRCVKEWEICDGNDDCLWGADEEPDVCQGELQSSR